jgi:hypothetical protein
MSTGPFTIISEYFRTDVEVSRMETAKRHSLRSAQYVARKNLRTANLRPNYIPEVSRVEDSEGNVMCVYDWDQQTDRAVLRKDQS